MGSGDKFRGISFAVAPPGPPSSHGQGGPAQGINDGHAVHRFAHVLENGVPEVLAPAFAVFVKGAVCFLCPEIIVSVAKIVDQPGNEKQPNGGQHAPQRPGDGGPVKQKPFGNDDARTAVGQGVFPVFHDFPLSHRGGPAPQTLWQSTSFGLNGPWPENRHYDIMMGSDPAK